MARKVVAYLRRHHVGLPALFLALSGTAYAASLPRNSVGNSQLRRNAVTSAKVRDESLLRRDFRSGQLPAGPRGLRGPAGPRGPIGSRGAAGRNAVTSMTVRDGTPVAVAPATKAAATVTCPAGEVVVSGGGLSAGGNAVLTDSFATGSSATAPPTGWEVHYRNDQVAADTVTARAVCATTP